MMRRATGHRSAVGAILLLLASLLVAGGHGGAAGATGYRWGNAVIGGGSIVPTILFHPGVPGLAYVRTDLGGFYRRDPGGDRWIPLTDRFPLAQSETYGGEA